MLLAINEQMSGVKDLTERVTGLSSGFQGTFKGVAEISSSVDSLSRQFDEIRATINKIKT